MAQHYPELVGEVAGIRGNSPAVIQLNADRVADAIASGEAEFFLTMQNCLCSHRPIPSRLFHRIYLPANSLTIWKDPFPDRHPDKRWQDLPWVYCWVVA